MKILKFLGWTIGLLIVAALVLRLFVVDLAQTQGTDMLPSVGKGAWLVINRLAKPKAGDLVMMKKDDKSPYIIRRVVALPGETVSMTAGKLTVGKTESKQQELRQLTVLGRPLAIVRERLGKRSYQILIDHAAKTTRTDIAEKVVDGFYVLADNRDHGEDSRTFGAVKPELVRGVVMLALTDGEGL